jgi:hypothetical protein
VRFAFPLVWSICTYVHIQLMRIALCCNCFPILFNPCVMCGSLAASFPVLFHHILTSIHLHVINTTAAAPAVFLVRISMRVRTYPVGLNPLPERLLTTRDPYQRLQAYNPETVTKDHMFSVVGLTIARVTSRSIFLLRKPKPKPDPSQDMPCALRIL